MDEIIIVVTRSTVNTISNRTMWLCVCVQSDCVSPHLLPFPRYYFDAIKI